MNDKNREKNYLENSKDNSDRKKDHIDLALKSFFAEKVKSDSRFFYEPMLGKTKNEILDEFSFLDKKMLAPLWVSSMTGGTAKARKINERLARVCAEFGLGMGLGSCRPLLENKNHYWNDFNLRPIIGPERPFYANLGIAQIEKSVKEKSVGKISDLVESLQADGLIIHVNPLQEWLQAEGDEITCPPLETIEKFLSCTSLKVIIKEVGQGMGPQSLKKLMELPLLAIEFGAYGGTNFSQIELTRHENVLEDKKRYPGQYEVSLVGHSAEEMTGFVNTVWGQQKDQIKVKNFIISGGIRSFLDGHYLMKKLLLPSIYGHAGLFLHYAQHSYEELRSFVEFQIAGLSMARNFLRLKGD